MSEPKENPLMEKIVALCKRRGFIYQSSEIYGGINGFWDYGPLGAELKRNVKELWWRDMVQFRDDVVGLEATIIMHPQIWKASGHVDTFADMMRECPLTKKRLRADQVEPQSGTAYRFYGAVETAEMEEYAATNPSFLSKREEALKSFGLGNKNKFLLCGDSEQSNLESSKEIIESAADKLPSYYKFLAAFCNDVITILLPAGKPIESAARRATEYYQSHGIRKPTILDAETLGQVKDSVDFHPESGFELTPARPFNLMFKTSVGPVESKDNVAYLRPETAQAIFAQFKNVLDSSRQKAPFGIAQIGKAFRNEVTPRNYIFRSREFEQMELEFFIKPDEAIEAIAGGVAKAGDIIPRPTLHAPRSNWGWEAWHKYWVEERIAFYEGIGLPRVTLVEYWQKPGELAHYARATVDILYKFPFSKRDENGELTGEELEGIAARGDFDLSQHERFSGKSMGVFDEELRAAWARLDDAKKQALSHRYYQARLNYLIKSGVEQATAEKEAKEDADGLAKGQYIPHVIEPSAGVDRLILALICNAYHEDQMPDEKGKMETRVVMRFHPRVAPIKAGVMPLLKNKPDLVKKAHEVRDLLRPHMNVFYDDAGAIGRRYRRQDEAGTPFCITIDFETLEGMKEGPLAGQTDTVTLRYRDDGRQDRVRINELLPLLLEKLR